MKRWLVFFLLLTLVSCTYNRPYSPFPDPTGSAGDSFLRAFGGAPHIFGTGLAKTSDGSLFILASQVTRPPSVLVMKIDANQRLTWQKTYTSSNPHRESDSYYKGGVGDFYYASAITPNASGGALIAFDTIVMEIDKDGKPLWSRMYLPKTANQMFLLSGIAPVKGGYIVSGGLFKTDPKYSPFMIEIREDPGGNVVVGPSSYTVGMELNGVVLIKIGKDGALDWTRHYPEFGGGDVYGRLRTSPGPNTIALLAPALNGNAVLASYMLDADRPHPAAAVVAEVNASDGSLAWTQVLRLGWIHEYQLENPTANAHAFNRIQALSVSPGGDILLAHSIDVCSTATSCQGTTSVVTRLNAQGDRLWSRWLKGNRGGGFTHIRSIAFDLDELVMTGFTTDFFESADLMNYNILLMRTTGDGTPLWLRTFGKNKHTTMISELAMEMGNAVTILPDRHILLAGTANSFSYTGDFHVVQPRSHFDLALLLTGSEGGLRGGGEITNIADFDQPDEVSFDHVPVTARKGAGYTGNKADFSAESIPTTTSDANLQERTVNAPCEVPRRVTLRENGTELHSTCSFLTPANQDIDHDGLNQDFEDAALALVSPRVEVDEEELWLKYRGNVSAYPNKTGHFAANFARVYPWPAAAGVRYVVFATAVAWTYDYGSGINTPVSVLNEKLTAHRGDSEKIFSAWRVISEHTLRLEWVETSAHDNSNWHGGVWNVNDRTCNRGKIANSSKETVGTEQMCGEVRFSANRVLMQTAENKHAMYLDTDICENHAHLLREGVDVWGEDCGWDPSTIPIYRETQWKDSDFRDDPQYKGSGIWEFTTYNAGEQPPQYRLVNDLGRPESWRRLTETQVRRLTGMFPGDSIWDGNLIERDKGFCGGIPRINILVGATDKCSTTIGGKLAETTPELTERMNSMYRVSITTGAAKNASTYAKVTMTLVGPPSTFLGRPVSSDYVLEGEFQEGQTSIFYLAPSNGYGLPNGSDLVIHQVESVRLQVSHDEFLLRWVPRYEQMLGVLGLDPAWLVVEVKIENIFTRQTWFWHSAGGRWVRPGTTETLEPGIYP
ncbi:MAG TPA: hypothetical protein VIO61_01695 [Anaerolineaceae bacterium]